MYNITFTNLTLDEYRRVMKAKNDPYSEQPYTGMTTIQQASDRYYFPKNDGYDDKAQFFYKYGFF